MPIDIVVAGGALVCFAPFAVPIATLAIRKSSPGPILFRQMRIGAGGRPFRLLKFRTMDNSAGPDLHRESIERSVRDRGAERQDRRRSSHHADRRLPALPGPSTRFPSCSTWFEAR